MIFDNYNSNNSHLILDDMYNTIQEIYKLISEINFLEAIELEYAFFYNIMIEELSTLGAPCNNKRASHLIKTIKIGNRCRCLVHAYNKFLSNNELLIYGEINNWCEKRENLLLGLLNNDVIYQKDDVFKLQAKKGLSIAQEISVIHKRLTELIINKSEHPICTVSTCILNNEQIRYE